MIAIVQTIAFSAATLFALAIGWTDAKLAIGTIVGFASAHCVRAIADFRK